MTDIATANSPFRVVPLPRFGRGGRWRTEAMRSYSQPVLIWFTRGQGRITLAGATRGYGAHNAIFLPPDTMHGFEMSGQVFGSVVYFPKEYDQSLPREPLHLRFREAQQQAELTSLVENLQRETVSDLVGRDRALLNYGGLLAVWLERQAVSQPEAELNPDTARRMAAAYVALVERDFHTGKSVNEYAADLGVTPTHLSRVCNNACGRPASVLLADRVFFEARLKLLETPMPVKTIARELGFGSAAYFTRAFQKNTGQTPTCFRKNS